MRTMILLILLLPLVLGATFEAIEEGVDYDVYTVEKCEGEINVIVIPKQSVENDTYQIKGCKLKEDEWVCLCKNPFAVTITTIKEMNNEFDFKIYYYVEQIEASTGSGGDTDAIPVKGAPSKEEMKKADAFRKKEINNFKIEPVEEDNSFVFPNISEVGKMILIISAILLLLGFISAGIWLFWKFVWSKEEIGMTHVEKIEIEKKKELKRMKLEEKKNMVNSVDDEIDNIVKEEKDKLISDDDVDKFLEDD